MAGATIPKILILEDDPRHMVEAKEACVAAGFTIDVNAFFVKNVEDGLDKPAREYFNNPIDCLYQLPNGRLARKFDSSVPLIESVDGVITDLYLPYRGDQPVGQPCGLAVVHHCIRVSKICVVCTAGHRHGNNYMWIHRCLPAGIGVVEMNEEYIHEQINTSGADIRTIEQSEAPSKDWSRAIEILLYEINPE